MSYVFRFSLVGAEMCIRECGYVIGAALASSGTSFRLGTGPFVVEADESDGSFRQYPADIAVITNVEADHLDNWGTPEADLDGFRTFAAEARRVVANLDDPGVRAVLGDRETKDAGWITFGSGPPARVLLTDAEQVGFSARARLLDLPLELSVPGRFNLANGAAAVLAAHALGVDVAVALTALRGFRGTARRFTPVGTVDGVDVVDDYAHHPAEVQATRAARGAFEALAGRPKVCWTT